MPLGIRYPKGWETGQTKNPSFADQWFFQTTNVNTTPYTRNIPGASIPVAPRKYSDARTVVFWCCVKKDTGTSYRARLRVAPIVATPGNRNVETFTCADNQTVKLNGTNDVWTSPGFDANDLYPRTGPTTDTVLPVGTDELITPGHLIYVEFDRFDPVDERFFTDWDGPLGINEYIGYRLVIERRDGNNFTDSGTTELQIHSMGVTVVQAPANPNHAATYVSLTSGFIQSAQCPSAYGDLNMRPHYFRWVPGNWDNVQSAHLNVMLLCFNGNAREALVRLTEIDPLVSAPPGVETRNTRAEYTFEDPFVGDEQTGDVVFWRSPDLSVVLSPTQDMLLGVDFDEQNSLSTNMPLVWMEIIQRDFNLTETFHPASNGARITFAVLNDYSTPPCSLFDPTWYQSMPDDRILSRKIYAAFRHREPANPSTVTLCLDSDLESNHLGLEGTSLTLVRTGQELSSTPNADTGVKNRYGPITPVDPLELAGRRKLIWGLDDSTATSGQPGDCGVAYALNVPNSEFLDLGDLFEVGAFDPEGCAATSAGLGDPGKLYISNGSSLPKMFDPEEGAIQNAGVPTPFPDELPSYVLEDTSQSPQGGLPDGTYIYRYTLRNCCTGQESDPNPDDITVVILGGNPAAQVRFSFAGVRIPADDQICEICLYRTVQNGAFPILGKVGCFNPDETTVFVDDLADSEFFDDDGVTFADPLSLLNAPMPCVPYIVEFRNRIFGAGDIPILTPAGTVFVTNGSDIIIGSGDVDWDRCLEGKYIQVGSDCAKYEIDRVLPPEVGISPPLGRLQLVDPYEGTTKGDQTYRICGRPNRLYYSEPLEGCAWPVVNFIDVEPGDGDRIMGLSSNFDRLVIYKRRKTYVMTFGEIPALEVVVPARISSDIGGVAPRSYAQIENGTVGLADRGLALFDGRGISHVPESDQANDIFVNENNPRYVRRDDLGRVIDAVGVFYPKREQYLLLLPTVQTVRGCNLMYVWDTSLRNVTILEFCQEFQSMVVGKDSEGNQRVYLGDSNGFVWVFDIGDIDGVGTPGATGTVRGTITASGIDNGAAYIEDSSATFLEGGLPELAALSGTVGLTPSLAGDELALAGVCIYYREVGTDVWVQRTIYASTKTRLYVTPSIGTDDISGYEYMIGAIQFEAVFKPFNYGSDDYTKRNWRYSLVHEIEEYSSDLEIELRPDFSSEDQFAGDIVNEDGTTGRHFKMDYKTGRQIGRVEKVPHTYMQVVLKNFAPDEPVRIINHVLAVTPRQSR